MTRRFGVSRGLLAACLLSAVLVAAPVLVTVVRAVQGEFSAARATLGTQSTLTLVLHSIEVAAAAPICAVLGVAAAWFVERTTLPGSKSRGRSNVRLYRTQCNASVFFAALTTWSAGSPPATHPASASATTPSEQANPPTALGTMSARPHRRSRSRLALPAAGSILEPLSRSPDIVPPA